MKKLILMLSMVFSLFMSMSVFAAGDYSIGGASWDTGDRALATWDEAEDKTKYNFLKEIKGLVEVTAQVLQSMISQNLLSTTAQEAIHSRYIR